MQSFSIDNNGYYGEFGGAYIPEILQKGITDLEKAYLRIIESESFKQQFDSLLRDYVGRPSPLYHSEQLSKRFGGKIYLKREDLNHTGAHKINNVIGQILIAREMGKTRIIAETGAGQHGVATATVCALMQMPCTIYMGKTDVERQMPNVKKMEMLGAKIVAVTSGSMTLKDAVNEAIDDWCANPDDAHYLIGSAIGPHPFPDMVARLQSVISKEIKAQLLEKEGRNYPDYLIACTGGGSNAAGTIFEFLNDERVKFVFAEAGGKGIGTDKTAATMNLGSVGVLHGCKMLLLQTEDGQVIDTYSISAGLDYPGIGPLFAHLATEKRAKVFAINDDEALKAAFDLTRNEGIIPALESSHALAVLEKMQFSPDDVVVLTLSGRGDKDMETYLKYI
ncbi:MAG: tryptophan synthase subunit beta [Dysgonamonadaceae bacterium]|jgi:tryptophan synthase beta chain|nr:tryptophan synthase subunit beta [Dysgonamonadaceae bacterium]